MQCTPGRHAAHLHTIAPGTRPPLLQPPSGSKAGIPLQTRGVLLSCTTGREQQAGREAVSLLTEVRGPCCCCCCCYCCAAPLCVQQVLPVGLCRACIAV